MASEDNYHKLPYISWLDSCFNTAEVVGSSPTGSNKFFAMPFSCDVQMVHLILPALKVVSSWLTSTVFLTHTNKKT